MLNPDHRDLIFAFSNENAEFLIVGAVAVAVHAIPRATGDLDVWVNPSSANAKRVLRALQKFGAPMEHLSEADLSTPDMVVQIGLPPARVDIMTCIEGVDFSEAYTERFDVLFDGVQIPFISKRHLIANKRATGRKKDKSDLEQLVRTVTSPGRKRPAK